MRPYDDGTRKYNSVVVNNDRSQYQLKITVRPDVVSTRHHLNAHGYIDVITNLYISVRTVAGPHEKTANPDGGSLSNGKDTLSGKAKDPEILMDSCIFPNIPAQNMSIEREPKSH